MALPVPSSTFSGQAPLRRMFGATGSGAGVFQPKPVMGMDYSNKYTTGSKGYNPRYRTLPLNQILAQREGNVAARYGDGRAVPEGMRINVPGFNTSGVGPGTRGYMGSYMGGGYNYGMGTGRPSARTADEFYAQRDEAVGNPLDNLELGNSNLMRNFLQSAMMEARGGQPQGAAVGPAAASDPWAGRTSYGDQAMAGPAAGSAEPDAAQISQMIADARRQSTLDELGYRQNQNPTFDGSGLTTEGATIEGMPADLYFQYKANETGENNRFATPPYAGGDTTEAWQYSQRLAPFLKRLGIGQPFPSRRPL